MSGILAVHDERGIPQDLPRYLAALRRLSHRGPLGESSVLRDNFFLGVRHLAFGAGAVEEQPLTSDDGALTVALDGHLHNRKALAHDLRARGCRAELSSDPALVLALYAEYGERFASRLRGVWALVVYDVRDRRLLVGRDPLGVRPLYYFRSGQRLLIASEIKSILALEDGARAVDHERVRRLLDEGVIDDWTGTCFAHIRPVPPGTVLQFRDGRPSVSRYWCLRPSIDPRLRPHDIFEKLVAAVERHTPSDVTVGLALSGGIDSSSLAGILTRPPLRDIRALHAFSIVPPHTPDESFLINATIRTTGLPHTYVPIEPLDYPGMLAKLIDMHDEPIHYSGAFYQFVLRQRMAEAGCRAVLVGYGADEIFGGYRSLAPAFLAALAQGGRLRDAVRFLSGAREFLELSEAIHRTRSRVRAAIGLALKRTAACPWRINDAASAPDGLQIPPAFDLRDVDAGRIFFDALLRTFRTNIPLLVRQEDRNAMAHGLELCAPFMDEELVHAALAFPFHAYMDGGWNKAVLRAATADVLAPEVRAYRRKLLTPGSDAYVVFDVLRAQFLDQMSSASFRDSGLWSPRCRELYEADSVFRARGHLWFRVFTVHQWYEQVVRAR